MKKWNLCAYFPGNKNGKDHNQLYKLIGLVSKLSIFAIIAVVLFTSNSASLKASQHCAAKTILGVESLEERESYGLNTFEISEVDCSISQKNNTTYFLTFRFLAQLPEAQLDYQKSILVIKLESGRILEYDITAYSRSLQRTTRWPADFNLPLGQFVLPCNFEEVESMKITNLMIYNNIEDIKNDLYSIIDVGIYVK